MSAHTPGPWTLAEGRSGYQFWPLIQHGGKDIAVCSRQVDETDANARLIAAAPDLYEALRAMIDCAGDDDARAYRAVTQAKAALAKAVQP